MALVKYSTPVEEIRGSIGGTTFTRSRAGTIARLRSTPRRPISASLALAKPYLASAVRAWYATLTQAQRNTWDALGAGTTWQNSLGQNYNPSGQNLYVRAFCVCQYTPYTPPVNPPAFASEVDPGFTLDYSGTTHIRITNFGTLSSPPDGRLLGWRSEPMPPAPKLHTHPWVLHVSSYISALPAPPWGIYNLGAVHPEGRMFWRFRVYRTDFGGPPYEAGRCTHPFFHQVYYPANP